MPFSALASYIVVASVTCPRRASETRTVPKVAAYRTSNVEEPAMDPYLKYQPAYRILVCRQCSVGVWPNAVTAHFRSEAHEFTLPQIRRLVEDLKDHRLDLCRPGELQIPDSPVVSLSDLPVYLDGQRCILDPAKCAYVCRNEKVLRKHWKDEHGFSLCEVLGGSGAAKKEMIAERLQFSVRRPIPCQRLFASRHGSQYFEVYLDTARPTVDTTRRGSAKDAILSELASLEKTQQLTGRTFVATSSSKEISPWLQLTRWLGYLDGCTLCDTARLAWSPSAGTEGDLVEVCASLDRILDQALAAIQEDRVNPFDQMRINSFLQRPRASDKPLAFRLQKSTHRAYRDVWKRLLCFAHRTLKHDQLPRLRHRLTNGQIVEHAELFRMVEYLRCLKASCDDTEEMLRAARADVDHSCLRFCMSLLDHTLNGDIYESVIVGFFAVAAIDVTKNILREAHVYSSLLSGFVKIAQMLVIQRAIVGVEKGEATYPAELIDELRERFLVYSSRTPFSWACRLRAYAKKVRDSTTSLGCILWNEEGNAVSYKQIGQLTMVSLREFVSAQVRKAQSQLEGLLLLHPQQRRNDLGVDFWMHRVADDASNSSCSWNFLRLERNTTGQLPIRDNWLLERVLDEHWLSDEFLKDAGSDNLRWRPTAVRKYKTKVEEFLESLLLLVHITGGQPGRGTELTSLRHMNTISGYHRNIFADHGIINTVTTYHKGYSITGSAKIIHRFLPKEVGELLVYYLWLVLPFCQKLDLLVYHSPDQPSSFLWPKPGGLDCWGSERLSRVLKREFMNTIGVPMSIVVWRHLAIAISRKHLACGGFKRDYDMDETAFDNQSCHSSRTAGSVYARGLQEAAGHIEARRASYRKVSQEWHAFLGFLPPQLPPTTKIDQTCEAGSTFNVSKLPYNQSKRSLEDVPRGSAKRMRREVETGWTINI